jgi:hypothetical protein
MKQFASRILAPSTFAVAVVALATTSHADSRVYPTDLTNIAAAANGGHIVSATSTFEDSADWNANNLIDGKVFDVASNSGSMGWSSNKYDPITMDSVTLAFADDQTKRIGKIVLNPTAAVPPERWAKDIEVQVSKTTADGPYRTAALLTLRREAKPQAFLILPTEAKYVRLLFRSNQGSDRAVALGEVEMYEAIPQTDSIGQLIARLEGAITELKQYRELEIQRRNGSTLAESESSVQNVFTGPNAPSEATLQLIQMALGDNAPSYPISETNIAAAKNGGRIVNYSSLFDNDANFAAKNLIDGQVWSQIDGKGSWGWSSEGFAPGREYVTFGFDGDRNRLIGKIAINPASNQAILRWARRIDVQVTSGSPKDGPWRTVQTLNLKVRPERQEFLIRPVEAKFVRLLFQANGPSDINLPGLTPGVNSDRTVSLGEVEVYEATGTSNVLDAVIGRFEGILTDLKNLRKVDTTASAEKPAAPTTQIG